MCFFQQSRKCHVATKGSDWLLITPGHTGRDLETKVADGQCSSDTGDTLQILRVTWTPPRCIQNPPNPSVLSFLLESPPCQFNPSTSIFCYEEPPSKFPLKIQDDGRLSSFPLRIESFLTRECCSGTVCS